MFVSFFYLLRQRGLDVAPNEWMTLLEGMEKGLHNASLTGFYHLCRAIVIKNETEFDRFDQVFLEFFKDVPFKGEMPEEFVLIGYREGTARAVCDYLSCMTDRYAIRTYQKLFVPAGFALL